MRFELTTSCTRNKRATRLRYAPNQRRRECRRRPRIATCKLHKLKRSLTGLTQEAIGGRLTVARYSSPSINSSLSSSRRKGLLPKPVVGGARCRFPLLLWRRGTGRGGRRFPLSMPDRLVPQPAGMSPKPQHRASCLLSPTLSSKGGEGAGPAPFGGLRLPRCAVGHHALPKTGLGNMPSRRLLLSGRSANRLSR